MLVRSGETMCLACQNAVATATSRERAPQACSTIAPHGRHYRHLRARGHRSLENNPRRRRFLGTLVRPVPRARPHARQGHGSLRRPRQARQGQLRRESRAVASVQHPLDPERHRLQGRARRRPVHGRHTRAAGARVLREAGALGRRGGVARRPRRRSRPARSTKRPSCSPRCRATSRSRIASPRSSKASHSRKPAPSGPSEAELREQASASTRSITTRASSLPACSRENAAFARRWRSCSRSCGSGVTRKPTRRARNCSSLFTLAAAEPALVAEYRRKLASALH